MTEREALKLALEALKQIDEAMPFPVAKLAQKAIKEALAQQEVVLPKGGHTPAIPVAVYGYCPECGGAGVMRERRPGGDDKCTNGHKYPSSKALAQPEQEPVWIQPNHLQKALQAPFLCRVEPKQRDDFVPLYITPFHRKPLTDVTIWNTYKNLWMFHPAEEPRLAGDVLKFARAIEAAHGIKE